MTPRALPPDIVQIRLATPFDMGAVNIWLLKGEVPTLIDMGIDWQQSFDSFERQLRAAGVEITDIAHVLCTHGHEDHVGLAAEFIARHEVPLYLHEADHIKLTDNRPGPPWMARDAEIVYALYDASGMPAEITAPMRAQGVGAFHVAMGVGTRSYAHPRPLRDGERFQAGDRTLTVVETPGHAPGQVCFLDEHDGFLFAGDQVLDKISPNPIMEHMNGERYPALVHYVRSLRRVRSLAVRCTCAGHGPPIWDTERVIREYFDLFEVRRELTYKYVRQHPRTAFDVTTHVYKHVTDWGILPAFNAGIGLLDVLADDGLVCMQPGEDGLVYWRTKEGT